MYFESAHCSPSLPSWPRAEPCSRSSKSLQIPPQGRYFSCVLFPRLVSAQESRPVIPFLHTKLCSGLRGKPKSLKGAQMPQMICPHPPTLTSFSFCTVRLLTPFKPHGPPRYSSDTPRPTAAGRLCSARDVPLQMPTWPAPGPTFTSFLRSHLLKQTPRKQPFNKEMRPLPHPTPPHPRHLESLLVGFNYFLQRICHLLAYLSSIYLLFYLSSSCWKCFIR